MKPWRNQREVPMQVKKHVFSLVIAFAALLLTALFATPNIGIAAPTGTFCGVLVGEVTHSPPAGDVLQVSQPEGRPAYKLGTTSDQTAVAIGPSDLAVAENRGHTLISRAPDSVSNDSQYAFDRGKDPWVQIYGQAAILRPGELREAILTRAARDWIMNPNSSYKKSLESASAMARNRASPLG